MSLEQDDLIAVRVQALNEIGWSGFSEPNSIGQTIIVLPYSPTMAPVLITQDQSSVQVHMEPVTGVSTGGSPVVSYELQYD